MAEIFPFHATHYNLNLNLNRVIAPPYDQISPDMQDNLYARDPHNFVRLIFGKILANDTPDANRYSRAADDLLAWMKDGVLTQEPQPAFFVYEQTFSLKDGATHTRLGLVGLMALEPLGKGVLPHEHTFAKPKEDRLSLMKACKANFEHIFFLYDDPQHFVRKTVADTRCSPPMMTCKDDLGTTHTLWMVSDPRMIRTLQDFFKNKSLLIADGHHRYETSLEYQKQMLDIWCSSTSGEAPFNFRMGTFVGLQDPGLVILPTHRVLRELPPEKLTILKNTLPKYFDIEPAKDLDAMLAALKTKKHAFGWVRAGKFEVLDLKSSVDLAKEFPESPEALRTLDVFLLQKLIFEQILKLPHDKLDQFISYVRWPSDASELVQSGSHAMAFLLNPTKPEQVKAVSESGEKMPHKSTDFYPKLWSGLVFYKMEM